VFEELLRAWDGEEVAVRFDAPTGAWMFVCVHSTVLGPAAEGADEGLREPQKRSRRPAPLRAMTSKGMAAPLGGGKAVLAVPRSAGRGAPQCCCGTPRSSSAHGTYGPRVTRTPKRDMDVIAERTSKVFGRTEAAGGSGTSAPATAVGVFYGLRAAVARAFGSDDLTGRSVAVQGVGAVGGPLARALADAGARPILADVDDVRAKELADELGCDHVPADEIVDVRCEVFSPCATGAVLSEARSRVCGAASSPAPPTTSSPRPRTPSVSPGAASCTRRTTWSTPVA
jgi:leucine dehydrogenase